MNVSRTAAAEEKSAGWAEGRSRKVKIEATAPHLPARSVGRAVTAAAAIDGRGRAGAGGRGQGYVISPLGPKPKSSNISRAYRLYVHS